MFPFSTQTNLSNCDLLNADQSSFTLPLQKEAFQIEGNVPADFKDRDWYSKEDGNYAQEAGVESTKNSTSCNYAFSFTKWFK